MTVLENRPQRLLLFAVLFFAAALRLHGLGEVMPMEDEYFQFLESLQPTLERFSALVRRNSHHLLLDPLATFMAARLGEGLFWLRLPAAVFGVLAVWGIWRLGGFAASLLLAVSLVHIDLSRRADFYALLTALTVWQSWAFFRLIEKPSRWPAYAALSLVFLHSHPYAVVLGALQGAYLLWVKDPPPRARRNFLFAWAAAAVLFAPWYFYSASALWGKTFFPPASGIQIWIYDWRSYDLFFRHLPLYLGQATEAWPDYGWGLNARSAVSIAYLSLYLTSAWRTWAEARPPLLRFCHLAIPAGIIAVISLDLLFHYFLAHRQLVWLLPFYLLAVVDGASFWRERLSPAGTLRAPALAAAAVLLLNLPAYWSTTRMQVRLGRGHEALVRELASRLRPGDVIASDHPVRLMSLLFLLDREAFRRADMGLSQDGTMLFHLPPGLRLRGCEIRVQPEDGTDQRPSWRMRGSLSDLSVDPPAGGRRPPRA